VWLAAILLLIAVGSLFWWRTWVPDSNTTAPETVAKGEPAKPSIVVLPFENLSDDPSQGYFADGITDDLTTALASHPAIVVISRNSAFAFKGQNRTISEIAEELGASYVLEGSVRRVGDQLRINAQLIDTITDTHLWAERYDGLTADLFSFQDKVTERIVQALAQELGPSETKPSGGTTNVAAYDAFLLGTAHYYRRTPEANARAVPYFERAIRLDPSFAEAYTALAKVYAQATIGEMVYSERLGLPWQVGVAKARDLLEKGAARPTTDYYVLRSWLALRKHQHDLAVAEARRALEMSPNEADALEALAEALIYSGRPEEGMKISRQALRRNPASPARPSLLEGIAEFMNGGPIAA
jgi:TolB-like protein